jgi:hypothetical protein
MTLVIFGPFRPGIDDHNIFGHRDLDVLHDKVYINDVVEFPVGCCLEAAAEEGLVKIIKHRETSGVLRFDNLRYKTLNYKKTEL